MKYEFWKKYNNYVFVLNIGIFKIKLFIYILSNLTY